jgi:sialic acid synthase
LETAVFVPGERIVRELKIKGRRIADDEPAWVCAEIGNNHGGSLDTALKMIQMAAECGADAVKLQKRDMRHWRDADPEAWNRAYESEHSYGRTYGEHRAYLEFDETAYRICKTFAEDRGLVFFATAFDIPSLDFLERLGVPAIKVASGSITNYRLLEAVAATGIPAIVSTGGCTIEDVDAAVRLFDGSVRPAILHCVSLYPCEAKDMNLRAITSLRERFPDHVIGLSDHQSGIALAPVGYALGARIVEKHFCMHRTDKGSDCVFSLEPAGLRKLTRDLRRAHEAMGDGEKKLLDAEIPALVKQGRRDLIEERVTA